MKHNLHRAGLFRPLLLVLALLIGSGGGKVWADSYTITFTTGTGDGTSASTSTACSSIVSEGDSYLTGNLATATKVYYGGSDGLKLGTTSASGAVKMNLASAVTPTSVVVNAKLYNSSKAATLKVNGSATQNITADASDLTFAITSEISYLQLESSKYCWIKSITVNYEGTSGGGGESNLTASDLALTGAPIALSFDLFNNSAAQTVSFSTSSTGAVTVSGGTGYVTTSVSGNTITVTPTAVTPSAQTITVSQAADDTYEAGSATFTVSVDDSTPFNGGTITFVAGTDKGSTDSNNTPDEVTKSVVTMSCTNAAFATAEYRAYKNSILTISTTQGTITSIAFTETSSQYGVNYLVKASGSQGTYDPSTGIWTGSSKSVSFDLSAQARFSQVVVTVEPDRPAAPTFTPAECTFTDPISLTLSAAEGASIFYTVDSSDPTDASTLYTEPITIATTTTVKAIAVVDGVSSNVATATYTYVAPGVTTATLTVSEAQTLFRNQTATVTVSTNSDGVVSFEAPQDLTVEQTGSPSTYDGITTYTYSVTAAAAGEYTLPFAVAENSSFTAATGSTTLTFQQYTTHIVVDESGLASTLDVYTHSEPNGGGTLAATVTYDNATDSGITLEGAIANWTGDNDAVATIMTNGDITLVGAGTVTFTATYPGDADYLPATVTKTITVTDSTPVPEETFTFSALGYENGDDLTTVNGTVVTLTFGQGTNTQNAPKYYTTGTAARMYNGNTLTVAGSSTITNIEFTFDGTNTTLALASGAPGTLSDAANSQRTWTGNASSVEFTTTATNRIKSIKVTYEDNGKLYPTIAFSPTTLEGHPGENVAVSVTTNSDGVPAFDATEGVTASPNGEATTSEGYTTYPFSVMATSVGTYTVPFTVTETVASNPVTGTVTLTVSKWDTNMTISTVVLSTDLDIYTNTLHDGGSLSAQVQNSADAPVPGAAIVWSSSNEAVATINEFGAITLVGAGSVTFTATFAGDDNHNGCTATTEAITVTNSDTRTEPGIAYTGENAGPFTVESGAEFTAPTLTNPHSLEVSYMSSKADVASVEPTTGVVTIGSVEGTATITASFAGNDTYCEGVATYTINVQAAEPGTQARPYTVAEAIAATPESGTTENVYIRGIVSAFYNTSIVGDGSNYRYYISDDGTTGTQLLIYKGKGLNNATFANADDLQLGGQVVVYGQLTMYKSAPEVASGNYLTSYTAPAAPVATPVFTPEAGTYTSTQSVTITCATEGATIYYTTDGTDPTTTLGIPYADPIPVDASITIKAIAVKDGMTNSAVATAEYTINLEPSIVFDGQQNPDNEPYTAGSTNVHYVASNLAVPVTLFICDENGEAATYDWFTAELSQDTYVAIAWQANDGEARTAYFKLVAGTAESEIFSVTQAAFVADYAELPFEWNDTSTPTGVTTSGIGTYTSAPNLKFDSTGDYIILKLNEAPGTLTFDIKGNGFSGGTFTVQTSTDGENYTDLETYTSLSDTQNESFESLSSDVRYIKWIYTNKSSGNVALGNIKVAVSGSAPAPVATPVFTPEAGTYTEAQSVTITCATEGATIYYTTDGTDPTITLGIPYADPIPVDASITIKAIAVKDGMTNSAVATAEYTINLEPSITIDGCDNDELALGYEAGARNDIHFTAANTTGTTTVTFCDSEGGALTVDPDWITASIDGNYVHLTWEANNDAENARTAYFKVTADNATSQVITITQARFVVDYATLPFAFDGGKADIANTTGLTQEALGSDYGSSPKLKFDSTGDYVVLKLNERPGILTFDIKGNPNNNIWDSTFKVQTSEDGETYTDLKTYDAENNTLTSTVLNESFDNLGEDVRYIKWIYTEKVNGNVALGNIAVAEYVAATPAITPEETAVECNAAAHESMVINLTYQHIDTNTDRSVVFCDANGDALTVAPNWIVAEVVDDMLLYDVTANTAAEARTAYMKVVGTSSIDGTTTVESDVITITQAAAVYYTITLGSAENCEIFVFNNDDQSGTLVSNISFDENPPVTSANVLSGTTIGISASANIGYENLVLSVTTTDGTPVDLTEPAQEGDMYTFVLTSNVTISATVEAVVPSDITEETITFSELYSSDTAMGEVTGTACTVTFAKGEGSTAPKYYATGTAVRAYGGNTITVASTSTIIGVEFTFGSSDGTNTITADPGTYADGTWTGSASSITFTIGGTSGNRRISAIKVTYEDDGKETPTFAITPTTLTALPGVAATVSVTTNSDNGPMSDSAIEGISIVPGTTSEGVTTFNVTASKAGTFELAFSVPASDTYRAASGTVTLTVSKWATHVVIGTDGLDENYDFYTNPSHSGGMLSAQVLNSEDVDVPASVSWSSSDESVATIDELGAITLVGAGSVTFTASFAGDDAHEASSATYIATVTNSDPHVDPELAYEGENAGPFTVETGAEFTAPTLTNPHSLAVSYMSSDPSVASVDPTTGVVTIGSVEGTAAITASFAGNDTYREGVATYTINVVAPVVQLTSETFTFSELGYENGAELTTVNGTAVTLTFDKGTNSNGSKYYKSGTAVRAYGGNTITVACTTNIKKVEFTFGSDDGSNAITVEPGTYADGSWTGSASSITFTIGGTSGNRRISAIKVTYEDDGKETPTFAITPATLTALPGVAATVSVSTNSDQIPMSESEIEGISIVPGTTSEGVTPFTITASQAGTYELVFSVAASESYRAASGTVALTVNKWTTHVEIGTSGLDGNYDIYTNPSHSGGSLSAQVLNSADGIVATAAIVWSSSDESVATIDEWGNITLVGAGSVTFTASFAGDVGHEASSATYTATVTSSDPHVDPELAYEGENAGPFTVEIGAEFTAPTLTNPNDLAVTYSSSDPDIASVEPTTGVVTIGTVEGTATITATYPADETYFEGVATYTIIVQAAEPGTETVAYAIATSITSGKHYLIGGGTEGTVGFMAEQKANNRGVVSVEVTNGSVALEANSDVHEFVIVGPDKDNNYAIYDAADGNYLYAASSSSNYLRSQEELDANGLWKIEFGEGSVASIVAQGNYTRNVMQFNSGSSLFACYGSASQSSVYLYERQNDTPATFDMVSITDAGFATYCSDKALDFTNATGIKAYTATLENNTLTFNKVTKVPANTGVLLQSTEGGAVGNTIIPNPSSATAVENNCLTGVNEETTIESTDYILGKNNGNVGFYRAGNYTTLAANRAYIRKEVGGSVKGFVINFGDDIATAIAEIADGVGTQDVALYNLSGQRISVRATSPASSVRKGIYILNGRKVLVK